MKTTLQLDSHLLDEAQQVALETGRTLSTLVEDVLRDTLARRLPQPTKSPHTLPTHGQGGLLPGVNLDHSAELADQMDGIDAASGR